MTRMLRMFMTRMFCVHWGKSYSAAPKATTTSKLSNFYRVYSEMLSSQKSIFGTFAEGNTRKKRSSEGKDHASKSSPKHFTYTM